jgi:hypothetical protein
MGSGAEGGEVMVRRVVAVAAVGVAALLTLGTGARAQTYPPPKVSITVEPARPLAGQDITVVLTGCKPGTIALIGIDLRLVDSPVVGPDGVATTTIALPARLRPGQHLVTGVCIGATGDRVVVSTRFNVRPAQGGPGPNDAEGTSGTDGGGALAGGGDGDGSTAAGTGGSGDAQATGSADGQVVGGLASLDALDGPEVPADAEEIFEAAAATGSVDGAEPGTAQAGTADADEAGAASDSGPGTLGTLARVAFGMAALGGVPVAMALSRRGAPSLFTGRFAAQQ